MRNRRGEIATILTIATLVIIGVTAVVSSLNLNKKQSTSSRASTCSAGVSVGDDYYSCQANCGKTTSGSCPTYTHNSKDATCAACNSTNPTCNQVTSINSTCTSTCTTSGNNKYYCTSSTPNCNQATSINSTCTSTCIGTSSLHYYCTGSANPNCNQATSINSTCTSTCIGTSSLHYYCTGSGDITCEYPNMSDCSYDHTSGCTTSGCKSPTAKYVPAGGVACYFSSKASCEATNPNDKLGCKNTGCTTPTYKYEATGNATYDCKGLGGTPKEVDINKVTCENACAAQGSVYIKNSQGDYAGKHWCCCTASLPTPGPNGEPNDSCCLLQCPADGAPKSDIYTSSLSQYGMPLTSCDGDPAYGKGWLYLCSRTSEFTCKGGALAPAASTTTCNVPGKTITIPRDGKIHCIPSVSTKAFGECYTGQADVTVLNCPTTNCRTGGSVDGKEDGCEPGGSSTCILNKANCGAGNPKYQGANDKFSYYKSTTCTESNTEKPCYSISDAKNCTQIPWSAVDKNYCSGGGSTPNVCDGSRFDCNDPTSVCGTTPGNTLQYYVTISKTYQIKTTTTDTCASKTEQEVKVYCGCPNATTPLQCIFNGGPTVDMGKKMCTNNIQYECKNVGGKPSSITTPCPAGQSCEITEKPEKCVSLNNLGGNACNNEKGVRTSCSPNVGDTVKTQACTDPQGWEGTSKYSIVCSNTSPWTCRYYVTYDAGADMGGVSWNMIAGYQTVSEAEAYTFCERKGGNQTRSFSVSLTVKNIGDFINFGGKFTSGSICTNTHDLKNPNCSSIKVESLTAANPTASATFSVKPGEGIGWVYGTLFDSSNHTYQVNLKVTIDDYTPPNTAGYGLTIDAANPQK